PAPPAPVPAGVPPAPPAPAGLLPPPVPVVVGAEPPLPVVLEVVPVATVLLVVLVAVPSPPVPVPPVELDPPEPAHLCGAESSLAQPIIQAMGKAIDRASAMRSMRSSEVRSKISDDPTGQRLWPLDAARRTPKAASKRVGRRSDRVNRLYMVIQSVVHSAQIFRRKAYGLRFSTPGSEGTSSSARSGPYHLAAARNSHHHASSSATMF